MASLPAVAPAPKMAALPNFLLAFLSHSPCWGLLRQRVVGWNSTGGGDGAVMMDQGYLWVLGMGGVVGV